MNKITKYITNTAETLDVPKEAIYDVVVALMAMDTNEEDIEEALKMIIEGRSKKSPSKETKPALNLNSIAGENIISM